MVYLSLRASEVALPVKNPPANSGDIRDVNDENLTPGSGRSPGRGHGNPVQYSGLENPIDRGAYWATVHRVAKSRIRLKQQHACPHTYYLYDTVHQLHFNVNKIKIKE